MAITLTFWGFWLLGRPVTLSPLEIGKALYGPAPDSDRAVTAAAAQTSILDKVADQRKDGTNAPTKELVRILGDIKVKYGEFAPQKLGFAVEGEVVTPKKGRLYH